jgi:putative glutamine amidotransferase
MEPVIGICAVRERARWAFWDQTAHLVADTYVDAVQATGAFALLLPVDRREPEPLLDRIDGLMVIGGADLDPEVYAEPRSDATEASYRERDEFELALTRGALERGMPFLGICRGMQLLNVALGGTLNQNLVGDDGRNSHRRIVGTFAGTEHEIDLEPGSLATRATGELVHEAHCHHHQAIDRLGEGLVVTGRARDGVAEAIEVADGDGWVLGVQWHPEASDKRKLFRAFSEAARERSRRERSPLAPAARDGA